MLHLGDITKIKGCDAPVVDCVIGGSPCQDLSMAGKRAGLAGERSGLYMEQIRIIKEMRREDALRGRANDDIRPRYMVWENVPGAFSSNRGKDFAAVLEEAIRVAEPEAPAVRVPKKGWPTSGCFYDVDGRWSVAWRVLDAQFWGVPQRRRRIALVADFGGLSALEILFVRKSVSGGLEPGEKKRKEAAGAAGECAGGAIGCDVYNFTTSGDKAVTLNANSGSSAAHAGPTVAISKVLGFDPQACRDVGQYVLENTANTITNGTNPGWHNAVDCCIGNGQANQSIEAERVCALNCMHDQNAVLLPLVDGLVLDDQGGSQISVRRDGKCPTLRAEMHGNIPAVVEPVAYDGSNITSPIYSCEEKTIVFDKEVYNSGEACAGGHYISEDGPAPTLRTQNPPGVCTRYIIRRLTPLECERLQGYPDGWTLIGDPVEEEIADYAYIYDESKYIEPKLEDFGLTEDDLNDYAQIDEEYIDDDNYFAYIMACSKARSKATKKIKVGSHKETNYYYTDSSGKRKKVSDSARYKALGNSIAIPLWKWVLKRLCACYERDATMASLFDGIGGFPYIWEQLNGKGSCLWASEIEEFPMAVTKFRFGGSEL